MKKLYDVRKITDLKDMINQSAALYSDEPAFLRKTSLAGKFLPITYRDFKMDIDALGTAMITMGMKGKKIALIGENRYEWAISYFATVNGTGIIVPFDKELPREEIVTLLQRSEVGMLIYSGKLEKTILQATEGMDFIEYLVNMDAEESSPGVLSLKSILQRGRELVEAGNRCFIDAEVDREAMAALLFTSGTTGTAKGVMLSHKNISSNVENMSKHVRLDKDRLLSFLPIHHTYECTCSMMTSLYQGSTLVFSEGLKYVVKNMAEAQVTVMLGVPLLFETMHKKVWRKAEQEGKAEKLRTAIKASQTMQKMKINVTKKLFKSVHEAFGGHMRLLISGAAPIDPQVIKDFRAMGINMLQGYGLTENAPIVAVNPDYNIKPASVGLPLPGTDARIINPDESGIGEIICKGPSVMIGYYENEEETGKVLKDGWLYTGDYGYFDNDGFLYITGRKKNVIVTKNGKNIFPEEVEFLLNKSEYIKETMVWGQEESGSGEMVISAEIVIEPEATEGIDQEQLQKIIKDFVESVNSKMPPYKRIRKWSIRDKEFDKTTTQKIKRHMVTVNR